MSKDSHPKAVVHVMVDDDDVTSEFKKDTTHTVKSGVKGLEDISYTTELKAEKFVLKGTYAGKRLVCKSKVGTLAAVEDSIFIKMQGM